MKIVVAAACFFALLRPVAEAAPLRPPPAKPNIVVILADDLGYGDVGFNGGVIPTPNLDRLAREGVQLTEHYVAPVCTPSRAGLLTGRYWTRFGVYGVQAIRSLPFDTVTLPRALKAVGYDTALMGKWHLGSKPEWGPNHYGFDYSYGSLGGGVGPYDHFYKKGPYMRTWHRNNELITEQGHVTDLIGNEAVKWIEARRDVPFLLYVPFTAVHIPIKEPAEWLARVPPAVVQALERNFAATAAARANYRKNSKRPLTDEMARNYAACLMHLDFEVGRIVAALEQAGKRANTLVVFASDNGAPTGVENDDPLYPADDYPVGPVPGSNRPLHGFKAELWDGGIHVAAVANWPGVLAPAKVAQPVSMVDWMPTFCRLAGYRPDTDLKWDGMDIWPFLTGETTTLVRRQLYTGFSSGSALRDGDWKLIEFKARRGATARTALFNLAHDPGEEQDLAARQMHDKVPLLREELRHISQADRDAMVPEAERDAMLKEDTSHAGSNPEK